MHDVDHLHTAGRRQGGMDPRLQPPLSRRYSGDGWDNYEGSLSLFNNNENKFCPKRPGFLQQGKQAKIKSLNRESSFARGGKFERFYVLECQI